MSSPPPLIPHRSRIATPLPQAQAYLGNLQWHGRIRLICIQKALSPPTGPFPEKKVRDTHQGQPFPSECL